jgi:pilus assembly protein Flp/PilA
LTEASRGPRAAAGFVSGDSAENKRHFSRTRFIRLTLREGTTVYPADAVQGISRRRPEMMYATIKRFVRCTKGATAIEYGLIGALIGIGIVASLTNFRDGFRTITNQAVNTMPGR